MNEQFKSLPVTHADLESLRAQILKIEADVQAIQAHLDPALVAALRAGEDPIPVDAEVLDELDAALEDPSPGVPLEDIESKLGL